MDRKTTEPKYKLRHQSYSLAIEDYYVQSIETWKDEFGVEYEKFSRLDYISKKEKGEIEIFITKVPKDIIEYTIPSFVNGIEQDAFEESSIKHLFIPKTITWIEGFAFAYSKIETVEIEANIKVLLGPSTFYMCKRLHKIKFPKDVKYIPMYCFEGCESLRKISLKNVFIDSGAFANCKNLEKVQIPQCGLSTGTWEKAKEYEQTVFYGCKIKEILISTLEFLPFLGDDIEKVTIAKNVQDFSVDFLKHQLKNVSVESKNQNFKSHNNIIYSSDYSKLLFCLDCYEELIVPNTVTIIGRDAFHGCNKLKKITLPNSLKTIETGAFRGCTELEFGNLPQSIVNIGSDAFYECKKIKSLNLPNLESIGGYAFARCMLEMVNLPNLIKMGNGAFSQCKELREINLPKIDYIESGVFENCSKLEYLFVSPTLKGFGWRVFQNCKKINAIPLPKEMSQIPNDAFAGTNIKKITLHDKITKIGSHAFSNCEKLSSIELNNGLEEISFNAFSGCNSLTKIKIPSSVKVIGDEAFSNCRNLKEVNIPSLNSRRLSYTVFYKCNSLEKLTLDEGVKTFDFTYYYFCNPLLKIIKIPYSLTEVKGSFQDFQKFKNLTILLPKDSSLSRNDFKGCTNIVRYEYIKDDFGVEYEKYDDNTLVLIKAPKDIVKYKLPEDVIEIKEGAFEDCCELQQVVMSSKTKNIENNTFKGCDALTTILLPRELETIGDNAFYGCVNLAKIAIPNTIKKIGKNAFYCCYDIPNFNISKTVEIGEDAFWGCKNISL